MIDLEGQHKVRGFKSLGSAGGRTKIFGEENHAKGVDTERDDLRDDHVNMPAGKQRLRIQQGPVGENRRKERTYQIVISSATIISSFKINAVNEMATMFKNSFSNRTRAIIMIAAPGRKRHVRLPSSLR
jgi:predicted phage tail protein